MPTKTQGWNIVLLLMLAAASAVGQQKPLITRQDGTSCHATDNVGVIDGKYFCFPGPEPMVVPAVPMAPNTNGGDTYVIDGKTYVYMHTPPPYTCTDRRRVLLTSEDGKKLCVLFPKAGGAR